MNPESAERHQPTALLTQAGGDSMLPPAVDTLAAVPITNWAGRNSVLPSVPVGGSSELLPVPYSMPGQNYSSQIHNAQISMVIGSSEALQLNANPQAQPVATALQIVGVQSSYIQVPLSGVIEAQEVQQLRSELWTQEFNERQRLIGQRPGGPAALVSWDCLPYK